jgi:hypothetical protein
MPRANPETTATPAAERSRPRRAATSRPYREALRARERTGREESEGRIRDLGQAGGVLGVGGRYESEPRATRDRLGPLIRLPVVEGGEDSPDALRRPEPLRELLRGRREELLPASRLPQDRPEAGRPEDAGPSPGQERATGNGLRHALGRDRNPPFIFS